MIGIKLNVPQRVQRTRIERVLQVYEVRVGLLLFCVEGRTCVVMHTKKMAESEGSAQVKPEGTPAGSSGDHLNIKVTDNNNEVYFRIKKSTALKKLIDTFCDRQGKARKSVRFLYDGERVTESDTPDSLGMQDGDTLEVHQEQLGGSF
ncbi:ubiquitin-related domain-containing protein [Lipomyces arxii]|uniref:ubiquitin-related domain-containing protein n=1 Tax=Lipomyces arxii TaxID=56418 RepID=UPI0034CF972C